MGERHADERGYRGPDALPEVIPGVSAPGALLLPRGQWPLNIFEPRYLMMIDDAFVRAAA